MEIGTPRTEILQENLGRMPRPFDKSIPKVENVVKSEEVMSAAEWAAKMDEEYFSKTGIRPVSTTFLREAPDKFVNKLNKSLSSESAQKIYKAFAK